MMSKNVFSCDINKHEDIVKIFERIFVPNLKEDDICKINIGEQIYHKHVIVEEIDVIMRIVQTEWYHLQSVMLHDNILSFSEMIYSRDIINGTLQCILESVQFCDNIEQKQRYVTYVTNALNNFMNTVIPLKKFEDEALVKISSLALSDVKCPIYQYFHSFLDVNYYLLALLHCCGASEQKLEHLIKAVLGDLMLIGKNYYRRKNVQNQQLFLCSCVKRFWLILQFFCERISGNGDWFWRMFNDLLENEEPVFTLWLLRSISNLQSYNSLFIDEGNQSDRILPNYILLESKLKILLPNSECSIIFQCFKIIEPLLSGLWLKKARIEVFQLIWDHYSKRLNISNKKLPEKALEFNETINTILNSPKDCQEDFEIFVGMLVSHLKEYPFHWGKMKGRIYSQLGPNKIKDLNEIGVTHVMVLFLSLASINFGELSKKGISFLQNLPAEKRSTSVVWNLYTVFIIRHVLDGQDVEATAPLMCQMLREAVNDKLFRLVTDFIENFEHIINYSVNYQLHQWLLIDSWLSRYLSICYYADLKAALEVILSVLEQVKNPDCWPQWEPPFRDHVYPSLKQISGNSTAPDTVGKIAGKLCLLMLNLTNDAFNFFGNETVPPKVSCQFLNEVLSEFPNSFILTQSQQAVVLQTWVKICLLTTNLHGNITANVLKLDCFPNALKTHISTSHDPIYAFIEYLGSDIKQHIQSADIIKLCETCFGQIDRWLARYLSQPEDEVVVFRVYTCISLAFLHCGPLLYDRNKSTSPLTKLVQVMLLPIDFLMGKKVLHPYVLNAVKKTWHIFFEAVVKLNRDSDTFLERTLRDMMLKYMQFFPTSDSPIIKCFENVVTAPVILDKISNFYFKHPVKESDTNIMKILKILSDFVQSTTSLSLMKLIIKKCLYGLFEVVIFHTQRNVALGLIKVITCSPLYPQIREDFKVSVVAITEKHLAFNTTNYFQLLCILAKFIPADVKDLLANIKQHISVVERMRGVGFDKNLRLQFEKLESTIESNM